MLQTRLDRRAARYPFTETANDPPRIAVLIPCRNEAPAIRKVIADFRACLPQAIVYVYDNNSRDRTGKLARAAGAVVRNERLQGKGHVVRRMFADVEADIYILVDGDDTYDATTAPVMVRLLVAEQLDMVTGTRIGNGDGAYRRGHRFGNTLLTGIVRRIFGDRVSDTCSPATAPSAGASSNPSPHWPAGSRRGPSSPSMRWS
jgi:glycosyltransferase involved in cell wall biosynthesis